MHITLAPMEGVVDYLMRELLSEAGGLDLCVTEFIRITDTKLPASTFYRLCPELLHGCRTRSQTPVHIQLLGNNPEMMAYSAAKATDMGALGIDINFGCPAKTVNKHKGGAVLLKEPELIHKIVKTVRDHVPSSIPVTAKMRLGYEDTSLVLENAQAIETAGASALTVHARTKVQAYRPPAHWEWIAQIDENITIPVTANGDIWTVADAQRIQSISGCNQIMVGRGILRNPLLAFQIKNNALEQSEESLWQDALSLLQSFIKKVLDYREHSVEQHPYFITNTNRYITTRIKQWLGMMSKSSDQALALFQQIKRLNCSQAISDKLSNLSN